MRDSTNESVANAFRGVLDFIVEDRIRLDAVERVLRETNPLMHEFDLGQLENLRKQEMSKLKRALAAEVSQR
jgi:hypothetical protein